MFYITVDCRFVNGHSKSVTFVCMEKLNKTLISAGSDGLVLVPLVYAAYGLKTVMGLQDGGCERSY